MKKLIFICITVVAVAMFGAKRPPEGTLACMKYAVMVSAKVKVKPPQIRLEWKKEKCFSYTIYRRTLGEKQWTSTPIASLNGGATSYIDKKVQVGAIYEYRIDRAGSRFIGRGYINCGIDIPLVDKRGKVILLVEKTVAPALKNELKRLEQDMVGDGWQVVRHDVSCKAKVSDVKKIIVSEYKKNPKQVKSVFLFGHIPIPYSGSLFPDGHKNHNGAWPADLYYGDVDDSWQDKKEHKYVNIANQKNVPGDGKFDRSTIKPNSIELEVGRVDLVDMPLFKKSETELLRQYLNKDHFFRHKFIKVKERALVDDNFGSFGGEAFGSSAWRNFSTFFSADRVKAADFFPALRDESYLWAYGNGGGNHRGAGGVGRTRDFANSSPKAVFTMLFGSYFGDWDRQNNFMRASLATSGYALTCAWDGRPHWYFHHMALGKNIGYSTIRTQNNHPFNDYLACDNTKTFMPRKDKKSEWKYNAIHVSLLGDPTLRMHIIEAPRSIELTKAKLKWASVKTEGLIGYHVYIAKDINASFSRLTKEPLTKTEFNIDNFESNSIYMVKTIALTTSGSGTYVNSSQGVFARLYPNTSIYKSLVLEDKIINIKEDHPAEINIKPVSGSDKVTMWGSMLMDGDGKIKLMKNDKYSYIPKPDYTGISQTVVIARDGLNDSNPAKITINIEAVADKPRAVSRNICLSGYKPFNITLKASDPDDKKQKLTYKISSSPRQGKLSGTLPKIIYQAPAKMNGVDFFKFTASDGKLTSEPATITIVPPYSCLKNVTPKKIDGKLKDWKSLAIVCTEPEEFRINGKKYWQGVKDNLFRIGTAYDSKYLYLAIEVIDDEHNSEKLKEPWAQDGIEIRFDARPGKLRSANRGKGEMKDFLFLGLSPSNKADDPWLYKIKAKLPEGTKYACVKTDKGFNTEIAFPISYIIEKGGKDWDGFRLNVCIDDLDKDGMVQIWWKPDWRYKKTYWGSGSFEKK
jgi:cellulose/xylan binding protein with CBM9 domain/Big-like domain-containing protein